MVTEAISRQIATHLKESVNKDGLTLEYASLRTGISKEGIRKALTHTQRFRDRTAFKLASFIEEESEGKVSAAYLLSNEDRDYRGEDLTGIDLSGEDLSGRDFTRANLSGADLSGANIEGAKFDLALMRGVNFNGAQGSASFKGATLDEANFENVIVDWNMNGASARNSNLKNATFQEEARLNGVNFSGSRSGWQNVVWRPMGSRTLGTKLPKFDPAEVKEAFCDHLALVRGLEAGFGIDLEHDEGDPEILHVAEFLLARESALLRCYDGVAKRLLRSHQSRIDEILDVMAQFEWYAHERLEMALYIRQYCRTLEDYEGLTDTKFYSDNFMPSETYETRSGKNIINKYIHRARRGDFAHAI